MSKKHYLLCQSWNSRKTVLLCIIIALTYLVNDATVLAEDPSSGNRASDSDSTLIKQYVSTKGTSVIVFDSSNIKQFWVDNTVSASKGFINVFIPASLESTPQKIQLANVDDSMDCSIEVLTEDKDASFSVYNKSSELLSSSEKNDPFLNYERITSTFHLEDADDFSFALKFFSSVSHDIKIKTIILSFSENKTRLMLNVPPSVKEIKAPYPSMSPNNIALNGDFETPLSGSALDSFKKRLAEIEYTKYISENYLFPQDLTLGISKSTSDSPPLLHLSAENPISGQYSFSVNTTQTNNQAFFAYNGLKKGNYIYSGLIKGIGQQPSELLIRPCYYDDQKKENVYLHAIKMTIEPNTTYQFQGTVRFSEIKKASFTLYFVGSGNFLFDNFNLIPVK